MNNIFCPDCKIDYVITKFGVRRFGSILEIIEKNYSGCGVDIYECPKCKHRFQVSYMKPNPNFIIICRRCGSTNIIVDSYKKSTMLTSSGTIAYPLIYCEDCENTYNEINNTILENIIIEKI